MFNTRDECCDCLPMCNEPATLPYEKCNDCEKTKGLPMPESFYKGVKLLTTIQKEQLPPFKVKVSKLPFNEKGIITIGGKEIFLYEYNKEISYNKDSNGVLVPVAKNKPGQPGDITIVKRGLHANGTFNGLDGKGQWYVDVDENGVTKRYNADYNNCKFMYRHPANSDVEIDANNHLFIRMATSLTCCRPATTTDCGVVKVSKVCDDALCQTVVSACDFVNCDKSGIARASTKCMPEGQEILVSWNDYSTEHRPGLTKVTDAREQDCKTGEIRTKVALDGDTPPTALNALQYADKDLFGSVKLSVGGANHIAHANNHHANNETAGLVKTRAIKQTTYTYSNPNDVKKFGDPLTSCGNNPEYVITNYDWADENTHGLTRLTKPSECKRNASNQFTESLNIALNKYDYASASNEGSVFLSKNPCSECHPIAVSDNDDRLFKPYLELYNVLEGGAFTLDETTPILTGYRGDSANPIIYKHFDTNIGLRNTGTGCDNKNSKYYGIDRNTDEVVFGSTNAYQKLIIPKGGKYRVDFQLRMFIDPNISGSIPHGVAQARVEVKRKKNGVSYTTSVGDKKDWIHNSFLQDLTDAVQGKWRKVGDMQNASGEAGGADIFLGSGGLYWFDAGDEVYVTCDLDTDVATRYRVYRQKLSLLYIDDSSTEVR